MNVGVYANTREKVPAGHGLSIIVLTQHFTCTHAVIKLDYLTLHILIIAKV